MLEVLDLTLRFGAITAFAGVSFEVARGQLLAVIGPNGAGKSSLFNVLSRVYEPQSGSVRLAGQDLLALHRSELAACGVARSFQNLGLVGELTALENVLLGRDHLTRCGALRCGLGLARNEERAHREIARHALATVGAQELAQREVRTLPYGDRKRVELARCVAMEPHLMLLDEPVAGMSAAERGDMTELIRRLHRDEGLTLVLVEHDMGMVMRVADRVLVLDFGRPIAIGTPAEVQHDERVIRAYLGEELAVGA
jgi:branched-chain amino acid transport system ATP-binding protein